VFDYRLLTNALAESGCRKVDKLEYDVPSTQTALKWTVAFRLLGAYRWEIDGAVRYSHREATVFARRCLNELAGEWWKNMLEKHPTLGGSMGFPIANLAPWSAMHSLKIKDFTAQETAARVAADVQTYVLPFVAAVRSENQYLELLVADEKPMQWLFCQPLRRFAEVVWLCTRLGQSVEPALTALARERGFMQGQLPDLDLNAYAERVIHAAHSDA
jgi:hypothetical protein